jgi:hypothetical protein
VLVPLGIELGAGDRTDMTILAALVVNHRTVRVPGEGAERNTSVRTSFAEMPIGTFNYRVGIVLYWLILPLIKCYDSVERG